MVEEQLISLVAEEDVIVTLTTSNPYIEVYENVVECSFQSLEVINTTFVEEGLKILTPRLSRVTKMRVKQTIGKLVKAGLELGKFLQVRSKAMLVMIKQDRYGLGYKPNGKEKKK